MWGMVGTLNLDNRSMVLNDEMALAFQDPVLGTALERALRDDLRLADELSPAVVARRYRGLDAARVWLAGRVARLL